MSRSSLTSLFWAGVVSTCLLGPVVAQGEGPTSRFAMDGDVENAVHEGLTASLVGQPSFVKGLVGQALRLRPGSSAGTVELHGAALPCSIERDFSVRFWMRTTGDSSARMLLLSQKRMDDNSLDAQKQPGWAFLSSFGTWAWNMGGRSQNGGQRRVRYERENGELEPLNDGRWHQLCMSYDSELGQVFLSFDGEQRAIYNLRDDAGFDFSSEEPLVIGWEGTSPSPVEEILPGILRGAEQLQEFVEQFNALSVEDVKGEEFSSMIVDPFKLYTEKRPGERGPDSGKYESPEDEEILATVKRLESALHSNPYTVHQAPSFMEAGPLLKIYSLVDGRVVIDEAVAARYSETERFYPSDFDLDELEIYDRVLSVEELRASYVEHFESLHRPLPPTVSELTVGVWNIFHGGLHYTVDEHGWDSRVAVARILEREGVDVVLMQETYSGGDFIAAELGFHFATTVDWDYLNQGSNISVLSRYPILEVRVPEAGCFSNVAVRVALSQTQDIWVMSNWYGMDRFADVYEFHEERFAAADTTPILFGGDFNAVPPSDGGRNPAADVLLEAGFVDAFREAFPDVEASPGHSHRSGSRIDQLYFKGAALEQTSVQVLSDWPLGFPSDHYLIRAHFEL